MELLENAGIFVLGMMLGGSAGVFALAMCMAGKRGGGDADES